MGRQHRGVLSETRPGSVFQHLEMFTWRAEIQSGAIYICAVVAGRCRLGGAICANEDTVSTISHLAGKGRHIGQR